MDFTREFRRHHGLTVPVKTKPWLAVLAVVWQSGVAVIADDTPPPAVRPAGSPRWEGFRNRLLPEELPLVRQNFGYRLSNLAGGRGAGEIGGTVQRSTTPARYAMTISEKSLDDRLSASGTLSVPRAEGSSGVMFGWFNENSRGWRTSNSLGFRLDGNGGKFWVFYEYGTRSRRTGGGGAFEGERYQTTRTPPFPADGKPHRWSLDYIPDPTGTGRLTFQIDERIYQLPVPAAHRQDGAVFNRFGIWNVETSGKSLDMYIDDLVVGGQRFLFDRDPGWTGQGHVSEFPERILRPYHNYGESPTNLTGGRPGEIGGVIFRDERPSYYAARTGRLTLGHPLRASGTVVLRSAGADSGVLLGWFNAADKRNKSTPEHEEHQPNYLGVMIEGPSRVGHYFRAAFANAEGQSAAPIADPHSGIERPVILPGKTVHQWTIDYEPHAATGGGRITVAFGQTSHTLDLEPQQRTKGTVFDRFGLFNIQSGGHHVEIYIDDLRFDAIPDEGTRRP